MTDNRQEGNEQPADPSLRQVPLSDIPDDVLQDWGSRSGWELGAPPSDPTHADAYNEFVENCHENGHRPEATSRGNEQTSTAVAVVTAQHQTITDTVITEGATANAIVAICRCPELRSALGIANTMGDTCGGPQMLAPSVALALQHVGRFPEGRVWSELSAYYSEHNCIPDRLQIERAIDEQNSENLLTPPNVERAHAILQRCYDEAGEPIDVESAKQSIKELLHELLFKRVLNCVVEEWKRGGGWHPQAFSRAVAVNAEIAEWGVVDTWPAPDPLHGPDMPAFPLESLPTSLRDFVEAESIATQTPPDLAAMLALSNCAAAIAKRVEVRVRDGYVEPVNLFTVTVLESGNRKSAVFRDVTEPTRLYEEQQVSRLQAEVRAYESAKRILEDRKKMVERNAARASDPESRRDLIADVNSISRELDDLRPVASPRLIIDDCTPERLEVLLQEQGGRIMAAAPEGEVFGMMRGRYSDSTQLGVYLCGHSGDDIRTDRISRESVFVHEPALTMALAVQPQVISGLGRSPELRGRGLLGRFLYSLPHSLVGQRTVSPPPVPEETRRRYHQLVNELWRISQPRDRSTNTNQNSFVHTLNFDADAIEAFDAFSRELEPMLGVCGDLAAIPEWGSKLAGAVARISGTLHVVRQAELYWDRLTAERSEGSPSRQRVPQFAPWDTPISSTTVDSAVSISRYLIEHAKVAFGMMGAANSPAVSRVSDARYAVQWIIDGDRTKFSKRELYKSDKRRFPRSVDANPIIDLLIDRNIIRNADETPDRGGRPSETYIVNPQIFQNYRVI